VAVVTSIALTMHGLRKLNHVPSQCYEGALVAVQTNMLLYYHFLCILFYSIPDSDYYVGQVGGPYVRPRTRLVDMPPSRGLLLNSQPHDLS